MKGISCTSLFDEIDEDGDGNITATELIRWMRGKNFEVGLGNMVAILNFFNSDADDNATLENISKNLKCNASKRFQGSKVLAFLGKFI